MNLAMMTHSLGSNMEPFKRKFFFKFSPNFYNRVTILSLKHWKATKTIICKVSKTNRLLI